MNECLTTPQHEKQIGYWVSEKGKVLFNDALNTFLFTVIWDRTYYKRPLTQRERKLTAVTP